MAPGVHAPKKPVALLRRQSIIVANSEHHGSGAKVAVLTFSQIARDRRVQRQCTLLNAMGHRPLVIAYANEGDKIEFPLRCWPVPQPSTAHRLKTVLRQLPAHLGLWAARIGFWTEPKHRWALSQLTSYEPQLVVANDWPALVVAAKHKAMMTIRHNDPPHIHYDTHEFATLEFDESLWWRIVYKPMVTQLERANINSADSVSTVGPRLAEAIQAHYRLKLEPAVVRNIPDSIGLAEMVETPWPLRILYHGQILPDRGLEALIDSVPHWREPHHLTIRGDGNEGYVARLKQQATASNSAASVTFEPAVKPDKVMPIAAATADVGVHFTPLTTAQRHFSLPNKLFEYIGAGLAVAVSPGADLKLVVESHGVGVVSRDASAAAVATAINGLTQESVTAYKAQARVVAKTLCWEIEQTTLRNALAPPLEHAMNPFAS
jgi:glycogen synthase